jgi:uncharacterized protein
MDRAQKSSDHTTGRDKLTMPDSYLSPGVFVEEIASSVQAIAGVSTSTVGFIGVVPNSVKIAKPNPNYDPTLKQPAVKSDTPPKAVTKGDDKGEQAKGDDKSEGLIAREQIKTDTPVTDKQNLAYLEDTFAIQVPVNEPRLFTNFSEFRQSFGDFSSDSGHNTLVHAVFGFFNNGGSRCYVARVTDAGQVRLALEQFETVDEIAIVTAPGMVDPQVRASIVSHCDNMKNRFAILDTTEVVTALDDSMLPPGSKNAAVYFPWIQVFDPGLKTRDPEGKGLVFMPPSGFVAGVYGRVDGLRGVFKAPANEVILGALGLRYAISKRQQDGLNPKGVNCIRNMNGNIRIWGARTVGGDRNGEWKYVNVRRTFLFLQKSIDQGTQWVVFEPNDLSLWAKITRNVSAFLTNTWQDGALFGSAPSEAFFVKCDRETNPPERRELGQVITEIGVAIVRPAEFVIFRVSQWTGPEVK